MSNTEIVMAVYRGKFPEVATWSDERLLRTAIAHRFFGAVGAREAIDEVGIQINQEFEVAEIADLVTIQSLVDLVDDRTAGV